MNWKSGANWGGVLIDIGGNVTTVGSAGPLSASYYGTFDQGGNVSEWLEDIYESEPPLQRVHRGGAWGQHPLYAHPESTARYKGGLDGQALNLGFRVVRTPVVDGDANLDGFVNDADLSSLLAHWNQYTTWNTGDFDGNGFVADNDLSILLANWSGPVGGVPEPSALIVLGLGAVVVLIHKR